MSAADRLRLDDKVVVLTGASSGLGVGFARALADGGARLVLAARRSDRLADVAADLRTSGAEVITVRTDVAVLEDCEAAAQTAVAEFGRIDVLVNNAGVGPAGSALREDPAVFRHVVDVNLNGLYWMSRACVPHMPRGSAVVNVASALGALASLYPQAGYTATKAGVLGLTRDLAQQWSRRRGIRVNALCPATSARRSPPAGGPRPCARW